MKKGLDSDPERSHIWIVSKTRRRKKAKSSDSVLDQRDLKISTSFSLNCLLD